MIPAYSPVYVEQHGLDWWQYAIIAIVAFAVYDVLLWVKDTLTDVAKSRWAAWQESRYSEPIEDASDDPENGCCALDPDHPGACEFICTTCMGSGWCIHCDGENGMDDMPWCDECTTGRCDECAGAGRFPEDEPEPWTPDDAPTRDEAERMLPLQVAYESRSET